MFVERVNVDQMGVIEDVDVGNSIGATLGDSPGFLGGEDEGYASIRGDHGLATHIGYGTVSASLAARLHDTPRDMLGRLAARWVFQPQGNHAIVLAARGGAGYQWSRDFELVAGGLNGLRAYPVQAAAGRRLWQLNAEDRWRITDIMGGLFSLGTAVFVDAVRTWGPGADSINEWYLDSGIGFRLTAPEWTLGRVMRFDLAWPINPTRDGRRDPVFSVGSGQAF
jgi:hypothetical protein